MDKKANKQSGFTLIEIIAVLVILGMLAAVAIPKYLSMQQSAAAAATQGALGAGASNASMAYSQLLLGGASPANALSGAVAALNASYATVGDFIVTYGSAGSNQITITMASAADAAGSGVINNLSGAVTDYSKAVTFQ
jgi:prepilin-type N-terminal cleavage/methylation domain-containing protein